MLLQSHAAHGGTSLLSSYGAELARILDRGQAELALHHGRKLEKLDALMRNIVQQSFDGILALREDGKVETANDAALRIFRCRPQELVGRHFSKLFPRLDRYRRLPVERSGGNRLEGMAQRGDGSSFPVELSLQPTVVDAERLLIAIVRDITEAKLQEQRLRHQAVHDSLTGLPNRLFLKERLRRALQDATRQQACLALLLLDLNRFKEINDTLGHHVGDILLSILGQRLRSCVRKVDLIARLGGDEFAILLPAPSGLDRAQFIARRVVDSLRQPFQIVDNLSLEVGVSIGIALFPEHALRASGLMQCADVAMYAAKRGPVGIEVYDRSKDPNDVRHLTMSGALRRAIEDGALSFEFQPKLDLRTGTISAVEALARWRQPGGATICPDEFVPQAEQTGLIRPFTRWSLDAALRHLAGWEPARTELGLAVNLSPRSLSDDGLPPLIAALLREREVEPGLLTLELTESAVMLDPDGVRRNLTQISDLGVRLSIDDFGTGYSSLSHLQRLPVHELKIDRSFVAQMIDNEPDLVIVRSMIDLAHNLGMTVVAEGVESERHLTLLRELGCDQVQGFFVAEPLCIERLGAFLDRP